MTFFDAMAKLATSVAEKAADTDTPLTESTDALKALTPYFAILYKANKTDSADMGIPTFGDLKAEIEAVAEKQNGKTAVPGGGRARPIWDTPATTSGAILSGRSDADAVTQGVVPARASRSG